MRLKRKIDCRKFLKTVQSCDDDVFFLSSEGDQLNLKSTLSQYMFAAAFADVDLISQGQIVCHNSDDCRQLAEFFNCERRTNDEND